MHGLESHDSKDEDVGTPEYSEASQRVDSVGHYSSAQTIRLTLLSLIQR